jgi:hypothetical protein
LCVSLLSGDVSKNRSNPGQLVGLDEGGSLPHFLKTFLLRTHS